MMTGILPIPEWLRRLGETNPALVFTIAYLAVSVVGVMFSWEYFRQFHINYFAFAEIGDVLLAVMREPMSLVAAAIGVSIIYLMYRYGAWEMHKLSARPNPGRLLQGYIALNRRWLASPWLMLVLILLYMLLFVGLWADYRAGLVRDGYGTQIVVTIADTATPVTYVLIGSSGRFVFLYDRENATTVVVPHEAIGSLEFGT